MTAFYYSKRGDTAPITDTLKDSSGAAVNLTGATVKFHATTRLHEPVVASGTVTGIGGGALDTSGGVQYAPQAGDVDLAQDLFAEWQVTYAGGTIETFPNDDDAIWRISPDLA